MNLENKPTWELKAIVEALSIFPILNTPEEEERLKKAKAILRDR